MPYNFNFRNQNLPLFSDFSSSPTSNILLNRTYQKSDVQKSRHQRRSQPTPNDGFFSYISPTVSVQPSQKWVCIWSFTLVIIWKKFISSQFCTFETLLRILKSMARFMIVKIRDLCLPVLPTPKSIMSSHLFDKHRRISLQPTRTDHWLSIHLGLFTLYWRPKPLSLFALHTLTSNPYGSLV